MSPLAGLWRGRHEIAGCETFVRGHKTSVSLEEEFWHAVKEIFGFRNITVSELVAEIDSNRQQGNLSSAIRLFVLDHFKTRAIASIRVALIADPL